MNCIAGKVRAQAVIGLIVNSVFYEVLFHFKIISNLSIQTQTEPSSKKN